MAYIWHMTANLLDNKSANDFLNDFNKESFVVNGKEIEIKCSSEHNSSGWEVHILLFVNGGHLNGHGGACNKEEIDDIDSCAKILYWRLGEIYNYNFALTGFEVGDWRSVGELIDDLSPSGLYSKFIIDKCNGFDGLVISKEMYKSANCPDNFISFSGNYLWLPFNSIAISEPI